MKTVEVRHGCLDAEKCGSLDHHVCGSVDACTKVKGSGVVCTFGTTSRATFHEQADLDAEYAELAKKHADQYPDDVAVAGAKLTLKAGSQSALRIEVLKGKNLYSAKSEQSALDGGKKNGDDNRSLHDANPKVFGHD